MQGFASEHIAPEEVPQTMQLPLSRFSPFVVFLPLSAPPFASRPQPARIALTPSRRDTQASARSSSKAKQAAQQRAAGRHDVRGGK